jgi:hypothetical protein
MRDQEETSVAYEETATPAEGFAWVWVAVVLLFACIFIQYSEATVQTSPVATVLFVAMVISALETTFSKWLKTQLVWWIISAGSLVGLIIIGALSTS